MLFIKLMVICGCIRWLQFTVFLHVQLKVIIVISLNNLLPSVKTNQGTNYQFPHVCLLSFANRRNKLPRSRTNSTENLLRPSKPAGSVERAKPSYRLSSSRCSSRGSSRGSSRRSSVELMSEEENWYDGRSSGVKSGGQKTRRVWGSSPNTAGTSVTPADTKRRSAKKQHGKT